MRIKICGITRAEDAQLAAALGADAVGFVFWPSSPRFIDPYRARQIAAALPSFVTPIGVFVDQPVEYVNGVARLVRLGGVQLHGHENAGYWVRVKHRIIKSVPVTDAIDRTTLDAIPESITPLLDVHDPVTFGGTGRTIDWSLGAAVARMRSVILAGGLRPDNVTAAIAAVQPYGVDVSSGVERTPGVKDPDRLRAFIDAVRQAASVTP
jgi:phosphoribosylanthranilate isomerase